MRVCLCCKRLGIDALPRKMDRIVFPATVKSIDEHQQLIRDTLKQAEEASRK